MSQARTRREQRNRTSSKPELIIDRTGGVGLCLSQWELFAVGPPVSATAKRSHSRLCHNFVHSDDHSNFKDPSTPTAVISGPDLPPTGLSNGTPDCQFPSTSLVPARRLEAAIPGRTATGSQSPSVYSADFPLQPQLIENCARPAGCWIGFPRFALDPSRKFLSYSS